MIDTDLENTSLSSVGELIEGEVSVYPNPVKDNATINWAGSDDLFNDYKHMWSSDYERECIDDQYVCSKQLKRWSLHDQLNQASNNQKT